jgi:hypothetical protein
LIALNAGIRLCGDPVATMQATLPLAVNWVPISGSPYWKF